jgi:large subunit ribosomal protein L15
MELHNLKPKKGSTHSRKRIARGEGSRGGTATRGNKGAQARTGYHSKRGFEGGQMPLHKRIPKYGFHNIHRIEFHGINLDTIQEVAAAASVKTVNKEFFVQHGLASKNDLIKVLGRGSDKYSAAIEVTADAFSGSAKAAIEEKKGKAIVAERKKAAAVETPKAKAAAPKKVEPKKKAPKK